MRINWVELVVLPVMIALLLVGWTYFRDPRARSLVDTRIFLGSAVGAGIAWALVRSLMEYRTLGSVSLDPLVSGTVLMVATILIRFVLLGRGAPK